MADTHPSRFWRNPRLPWVEARVVADGRSFCHAAHSHESFSIGAIVGGRSTYRNGHWQEVVGAGSTVIMNPGDVHACNPVGDGSWAYVMLYIDAAWLGARQAELGLGASTDFHPIATKQSEAPALHRQVLGLYRTLADGDQDPLACEQALVTFASQLHTALSLVGREEPSCDPRLRRAEQYIRAHCLEPISLDDICTASGLSASHLIRTFKRRYGLTPHEFVVNGRIQYARRQLRQGRPIAEVAQDAGFADQAHLQRTFKRYLAATPGHYQASR
ncbi:AraC family transcriptional regulator [Pyxidicoccus fallax]|uniref:AraC family transcriptional regulator n=1 Tax=Pyxidicoccus fallax TaxID=394095 RepID=A0A848L887_9BACT|nr:AraC family transcriptional regulator [Pyxidicoccus fallax]NMO15210.1 AraC family transcriptional regulator [Pyxidicoccus fallax]NPC76909.1 AraC family transcriptional regulator [Pyxidicoccus fallax]